MDGGDADGGKKLRKPESKVERCGGGAQVEDKVEARRSLGQGTAEEASPSGRVSL